MEPEYWRQRLFKNTFTYKGRLVEVKGWSVKIQLFGKRKTFSLNSGERNQAATEACQIYQTILTQGWDAMGHRRGKHGLPGYHDASSGRLQSTAGFNLEQWKLRLIRRRYPETSDALAGRELSVRVEHAGVSRYFPLGTDDETQAAAEAMRIHQTVVTQGWASANQEFRRELTLALRWLDDPLAWTYTTIHTRKHGDPPPVASPNPKCVALNVAIIEPDAGIRSALAICVGRQDGIRCSAACSNGAEALREITRQRVDLALVNHGLPDLPGSVCVEELRRLKPGVVGLLYSIFEDSDQLFKATPGGAAGYMLKRTPPSRIFEPLAGFAGILTRELMSTRIRDYFQKLVAAMPAGPSALELADLTPREHEILALLGKGDLAKEIADSLGISIWTVHGHIKSIFEKLNVHTRTEAVVKFLQK